MAVRKAVEELIAEQGSDAVTIPMVAERAGVNHSSIYRRWGDARTMVNDLATYRLDADRGLPDTGDLGADLTAWAQELIDHYSIPVNAALLRGGAAAAGDSEIGLPARPADGSGRLRRPARQHVHRRRGHRPGRGPHHLPGRLPALDAGRGGCADVRRPTLRPLGLTRAETPTAPLRSRGPRDHVPSVIPLRGRATTVRA
ncbi:helix-turn-helix domain-containing protein [Streptomyces sp. L7]